MSHSLVGNCVGRDAGLKDKQRRLRLDSIHGKLVTPNTLHLIPLPRLHPVPTIILICRQSAIKLVNTNLHSPIFHLPQPLTLNSASIFLVVLKYRTIQSSTFALGIRDSNLGEILLAIAAP